MEPTIWIDIDGLPAEVDAADYGTDPDTVIDEVRKARAAATDLTDIHDEADWDYDSLASAYGEDNETEVSE